MSSPSPGKRRMDTDVIKLYPCRSSWYRLLISRALVGKVTSHNGAFCTYPGVFFFSVSISLFLDYILIRIESKHEVTILGGLNEFIVKFFGPSGSKCEHIFMF